MLSHSGLGLVLRRKRHMEEDMRLTLFLREVGKVIVLAKGGSKFTNRLKALQEPLTEAEYHVSLAPHGIHARLIGGKMVASAYQISQKWDNFSVASKCCEAVDLLVPFRAPSPDVYDILRSTLHRLATTSFPAQQWVHFNVRFLNTLGYGDISEEVLKLLQPDESKKFKMTLLDENAEESWRLVSESSLNRCQAYVEARLGALLPWQLKSSTLESDLLVQK